VNELAATATSAAAATATRQSNATATAEKVSTIRGEHTATAEAQQAATATAQAAALEEVQAWKTILSDPFDTQQYGWYTGPYFFSRLTLHMAIKNGKYIWDMEAKDPFFFWGPSKYSDNTSFALSVDAERVTGETQVGYGLIFQSLDDNDMYVMLINDDGAVFVSMLYKGDWQTPRVALEHSDSIRPGEVNRLTVIAHGPKYQFFINDQFVGAMEEDRLTKGYVGVATDMGKKNTTATVQFDNFELKAP